jgi:tyrosinase
MGVRRETDALDAQTLAALQRAFGRSYGIHDERGYAYFAGLHGLPLPSWCPHHTWYFLPWHRALLYFFERSLQDLEPAASLAWWDWSTDRSHREGIPAAFRRTPARINLNPLATGPVPLSPEDLVRFRSAPDNSGSLSLGALPWTLRDPAPPDELPTLATVRRALTARSYTDFSLLVESIHAGVHTWVGGAMSLISVASYDPIFYAHHAMIDRLWYVWQAETQGRPPAEILDHALAPFPMTVRDTLDISRLGYEYAVQVVG